MIPTAHQVRELCTELKFISKIGEDEKIRVGTKQVQCAKSWFTVFIRMLTGESNNHTLNYIREKTDRAIEYCDLLLLYHHDPNNRDLIDMLRDDLEDCVSYGKKRGLEELHKTYSDKQKPTAEIEEIVRYVRMKLDRYNKELGQTKKNIQSRMINQPIIFQQKTDSDNNDNAKNTYLNDQLDSLSN